MAETPKYFEDQLDDEEVLYVFRKHPITMRKGIIVWALTILVGPLYTTLLSFIYANNPEKYPTVGFLALSLFVSFIVSFIVFTPWWIACIYRD